MNLHISFICKIIIFEKFRPKNSFDALTKIFPLTKKSGIYKIVSKACKKVCEYREIDFVKVNTMEKIIFNNII